MSLLIPKNVFFYTILLAISFGGFAISLILPQDISSYALIAIISVGGFLAASYIFYKKKTKKTLMCAMGSNCNTVIYSKYSKFFGIPIEYLGMFYYFIIFVIYLMLISSSGALGGFVGLLVFIVTGGAFLFSLYLLFIQGFVLKQWCMWCLFSAISSIAIFIVSFGNLSIAKTFLVEILPAINLMNFFGLALGLGGATISIFLFFKYLRDFSISKFESDTLSIISELVWFALGVIIISELLFYTGNSVGRLDVMSQFLIRIIILGIITVIATILNLVLMPYLNILAFGEDTKKNSPALARIRRVMFFLGGVFIVSWYVFSALSVLQLGISFRAMLGAYAMIIFIAGSVALVIERNLPIVEELFTGESSTQA